MTYERQMDLSPHSRPAEATLPPPLIDEAAWDILLALHSEDENKLSLGKLASVVSVPLLALNKWLALLEERRLITGAMDGEEQELRAVLTSAGRELLDCYLSVTSGLQIGSHH